MIGALALLAIVVIFVLNGIDRARHFRDYHSPEPGRGCECNEAL